MFFLRLLGFAILDELQEQSLFLKIAPTVSQKKLRVFAWLEFVGSLVDIGIAALAEVAYFFHAGSENAHFTFAFNFLSR
jgi:FAD/FMN-containing dehydrogenase